MTNLKINIAELHKHIRLAEQKSARAANSVQLLAVSKTQPSNLIRLAYELGIRDFGENYLQESLKKMAELEDLAINWHFIGPLQTNKTKPVAEHYDWLHTLDRVKIGQRLNDQRPAQLSPLNCCIQVNIDHEDQKSGVAPEQLADLATAIAKLPNLTLRGLMVIPKAEENSIKQRQSFAKLANLYTQLKQNHPTMDTMSMGMSADMDVAIEEGATIVRIGTALFGSRQVKDKTNE